DTLLLAVIREFERDNLIFESALKYCSELLVKHGFLTRRKPTPAQWKDINFGWELAKEMGRLDVGQSVMIKDTAVLAIEAIEGTENGIRRAGELCRKGGFTVVKVAKPSQDMRFDVPTIGMQTIHTMHESGAKVLAVESDKTIILDQEAVLRLAEQYGISLVALNAEEKRLRMPALNEDGCGKMFPAGSDPGGNQVEVCSGRPARPEKTGRPERPPCCTEFLPKVHFPYPLCPPREPPPEPSFDSQRSLDQVLRLARSRRFFRRA